MILRLAWQNVLHKKVRALASIGGVAFSILLIFMQLGIFSAAEESAEIVYQALDFDIALVSPQYVFLANAGAIPRETLAAARSVSGVASVAPLHAGFALYRNVEDRMRRGLLLFGVDTADSPFRDPEINEQAYRLAQPGSALVDREARGEYGPRTEGIETDLADGRIRIVGNYTLGTGFIAGADAVVSEQTFLHLLPGRRADRPTMGLVKAVGGRDIDEIANRLRARLGEGVTVYTRDELEGVERNYFVNVKPIGIMFRSGVIVGFLVGAVTLYQILATQVANHIAELATMKAMGFADRSVYNVVIFEGFIYAVAGYIPAYFGGIGLYQILRSGANVPVWMTWDRAILVLILTIVMCSISSVLALRRVRTADPAELFR